MKVTISPHEKCMAVCDDPINWWIPKNTFLWWHNELMKF